MGGKRKAACYGKQARTGQYEHGHADHDETSAYGHLRQAAEYRPNRVHDRRLVAIIRVGLGPAAGAGAP